LLPHRINYNIISGIYLWNQAKFIGYSFLRKKNIAKKFRKATQEGHGTAARRASSPKAKTTGQTCEAVNE